MKRAVENSFIFEKRKISMPLPPYNGLNHQRCGRSKNLWGQIEIEIQGLL